jgi:hypothetical protein
MPAAIRWAVQQGEHLAARAVMAGTVAKVDQLTGDRLDAEPVGQGGGQQQPSVGDRVVGIEGDREPAGLWEDGIEKVPSKFGILAGVATAILPAQRAFLIIGSCPSRRNHGGSRLNS